ncbi:MAG: DUF4221 family protein [Flavobacteriales bacterium]
MINYFSLISRKGFLLTFSTFLLFVTLSCVSKQKNKEIFKKITDLNIKRPSGHEDFFFSQVVKLDSIEYLAIKLTQQNKIDFINLYNQTVDTVVNIPIKKSFKSFNVISFDSIYFMPNYTGSVYLFSNEKIDTIVKGGMDPDYLKHFDMNETGPKIDVFNTVASPMFYVDNNFYFNNMIDPTMEISSQKPMLIYKISGNDFSIKSNNISFPDNMLKKEHTLAPFDMYFCYTLNNRKELVYSFCLDHFIYSKSYIDSSEKHLAKSDYFDEFPKFIKNKEAYNFKLLDKREEENYRYGGIFYDDYRDIYYRVVLHPKTKNEGQLNDKFDFKFSIIVLNKDYKKIGEQLFNFKDYLGNQIHIVKEGIMLKKHDDLSGFSRFTIFKPQID